jgi:hypothetical protein
MLGQKPQCKSNEGQGVRVDEVESGDTGYRLASCLIHSITNTHTTNMMA